MRFSIVSTMLLTMTLAVACGKKSSKNDAPAPAPKTEAPAEPNKDAPAEPKKDEAPVTAGTASRAEVQTKIANACVESTSDSPAEMKEKFGQFCQCLAKGHVEAMVKKCGGTDTSVTFPCDLTEAESDAASSSCESIIQ